MTSLRQVFARTPACYDNKTHVLTWEGWKPWPKVTGQEKFATWNVETGKLEYQRATSIYREQYKGKMIKFAAPHADLLVTPNHRMFVKRVYSDGKRGEQSFGFVEAQTCMDEMWPQKSATFRFKKIGDRRVSEELKLLKPPTEEDYDGIVYCVEVPNHTLYVWRNGKPVWCGNHGRT